MEGRKGRRKEREREEGRRGGKVIGKMGEKEGKKGRKEENFDKEAKFTKRKATRVPSKPLAPYPAVLT